MAMKNENVEIKTNEINIENKVNLDTVVKSEVNLETVKSVANLTRKDWFAMFYEVFQMFENNDKLYDYREELMSAIADATDVIIAKNRYEKDDNSVA